MHHSFDPACGCIPCVAFQVYQRRYKIVCACRHGWRVHYYGGCYAKVNKRGFCGCKVPDRDLVADHCGCGARGIQYGCDICERMHKDYESEHRRNEITRLNSIIATFASCVRTLDEETPRTEKWREALQCAVKLSAKWYARDVSIERVEVAGRECRVWCDNGTCFKFPCDDWKLLRGATDEQLEGVEISGGGAGLRWKELDEDLSCEGLLRDYGEK